MEFTLNINLNGTTERDKAENELEKKTGKEPEKTAKNKTEAKAKLEKKTKKKDDFDITDMAAYHVGKKAVQQVFSVSTSQYGAKTSDVVMQSKINNTMAIGTSVAKYSMMIATGHYEAVALMAASDAISMVTRALDYMDLRTERMRAESRSSERLGIVSSRRNR